MVKRRRKRIRDDILINLNSPLIIFSFKNLRKDLMDSG